MIKQTYKIRATVDQVWRALTDPGLIEKWSGAPAEMSTNLGDFRLWNGDIWGENTFISAPTHLEQDWYGDKWDKPSKVCIALTEAGGVTTVHLRHSEIPENESDFASGWRDYYFDPIKDLLEKA
jgi:uncharacterized protein YndB with AHSA1/START domain